MSKKGSVSPRIATLQHFVSREIVDPAEIAALDKLVKNRKASRIRNKLVELAEDVIVAGVDDSYLAEDGQAYVLAIQGDRAKAAAKFMKAVGRYLLKLNRGCVDRNIAKAELIRALDTWLQKQEL